MSLHGRRRRGRTAALGLVAGGLLLSACGGGSDAAAGTAALNFYIYNPGAPVFEDAAATCSADSDGEYDVTVQYLPSDADGQRQQMVRRLAAQDDSLDILGLDVTWTSEFAEAGWINPWPADEADEVRDGTLDAMIETATYEDELYSAPFNTNTQLLWYRKDLVPTPPETWDEMIEMAEKLNEEGKPHLAQIQGAQYEGYVVWFNTMVNSAGGEILSPDGQQPALGEPTVRALETMKKFATSAAADPSLSNQQENDNRLAFEDGSSAFQMNYPFIYPSAQENVPDLFENIGWAPYPKVVADEPVKPTIGGIDLAVSAYSQYPDEAFDAIQCIRGRDNQLNNAIAAGLPPVLTDIYENPPDEFVDAYPFYETIYESLLNASTRPLTPAYQNISIQIASVLSPPSDINPEQAVETLQGAIDNALQSKGVIP